MSPTTGPPAGLKDQLAAIKAATAELSTRFGEKDMSLVNNIVEAAESGKQLEVTQVLSGLHEIMARQIDVEERVKALTDEVGKYHGANVWIRCHCRKVLKTVIVILPHPWSTSADLFSLTSWKPTKGMSTTRVQTSTSVKDATKCLSMSSLCNSLHGLTVISKSYKVKGAFEKHQENNCPALLEKRASAFPQNVYGLPVFLPALPRAALPVHPPFIDTRPLYGHEDPFHGLPAFQGSADPDSLGSSHPEPVPQGHLNFLPQPFVVHSAYHPPPTEQSEHNSTPFSSPSSRASACNVSAQDQRHMEKELDVLPQPVISFWSYQIQQPPARFSVPENSSRRPSDPYPFGGQGTRPQQMDGNRQDQQPPIKRRRSEQVSRLTRCALVPANSITSPPLQPTSMARSQPRSPRKSKSQSPARNTSPDISSQGVVPGEASSTPVRGRSQELSDTASTENTRPTDVYSGVPLPISLQAAPAPQRPRYGSQTMEPGQQYQLGEPTGPGVNLADTCSGPFAGFPDSSDPASGSTYPPGHLDGMDRQHPGPGQYFGSVFQGSGWGHFTVPDWSGRGGHGGYTM